MPRLAVGLVAPQTIIRRSLGLPLPLPPPPPPDAITRCTHGVFAGTWEPPGPGEHFFTKFTFCHFHSGILACVFDNAFIELSHRSSCLKLTDFRGRSDYFHFLKKILPFLFYFYYHD